MSISASALPERRVVKTVLVAVVLLSWAAAVRSDVVTSPLQGAVFAFAALVVASWRVGTPGRFVRDWVPFMAAIGLYTVSRGLAGVVDLPTHWTPQLEADRWIGGGVVPTVFLQERLLLPGGQVAWWERIVAVVYVSHFVAAILLALHLWFRSTRAYWAFVVRLVGVLSLGVVIYVLVPAAPPWAAARCTAAEVADHDRSPSCIDDPISDDPTAVLLPTPGSKAGVPAVQRLTTRGFAPSPVPENRADTVGGLAANENLVAAIPSLHAACSLLVALFLIRRGRRKVRWLWLAYPLAMAFTLVWTGDHYVVDIGLGWGLVLAVDAGVRRLASLASAGRFRAVLSPHESVDRSPSLVRTARVGPRADVPPCISSLPSSHASTGLREL